MSERRSLSSTKYGPSVSAAVSTHELFALPGIVGSPFTSVALAEHAKIDCETTRVAAAFAARPKSWRRFIGMTQRHTNSVEPCHPERSEGPACRPREEQVLRFAQDDS